MAVAGPTTLGIDLSEPPPIPEAGIARAVEIMRGGRLHRYGEADASETEVARLEAEFAALVGRRFAVAVNSCGSAMFLALLCSGVQPGEPVLMNGFTLAPAPGAIAHAGARHVLVEIDENYVIDLADLERKAVDSGARCLLLSHMRGHIADMQAVMALCDRLGIAVVEDCAHTMGAAWAGTPTGAFGKAGCFSVQSYKHANAGEGGILVTDDEDIAARAILHSGSYMFYGGHGARPADSVFERWKYLTPNFSLRMSNLVAALVRPQLALLPERARVWNAHYTRLATQLAKLAHVRLPHRPQAEQYVASSIQFSVRGLSEPALVDFLARCERRGVYLKWFGNRESKGFTSVASHWRYMCEPGATAQTAGILERLCDMRIPLALTPAQCDAIMKIIARSLGEAEDAMAHPKA
jgi:dTDP-4-amino-4,6-dideoxygalactose transaminase